MNSVLAIGTIPIRHTFDNRETLGLIPVLAHQGGWDEALLVALPLAIIGLLLWVANRRVSAKLASAALSDQSGTAGDATTSGAAGSNDTPDAR